MSGEPNLDLLSRIPDPFADDSAPLPAPPSLPPSPGPTRASHRGRITIAVVLALAFQVVLAAFSRHAVALADVTPERLTIGLGVPLASAIAAWLVATQRGPRGLGARTALLAVAIVAAPLLFALTTLAFAPADHDPSVAVFVDKAVRCLLTSGVLCAVALGLAALAFRHSFAAASTWRAAALGTACGGLAAATMSVACFHGEALHLLMGHGSMMLIGAAGGALLGRRFTRI